MALASSLLDRRRMRGTIGPEGGRERGKKVRQKKVDFGRDTIDDDLDWAVRCKGCGELYVLREVGAEETPFTVAQHTIPSHKTYTVE
jgi:hypothetical protein